MRPYFRLTFVVFLFCVGAPRFANAQTPPNRANSSGRLEETLRSLAALPDLQTVGYQRQPTPAGKKRPLTAKEKAAVQAVTALREELRRFARAAPSPEAAAEQWTGFVDRYFALLPRQGALLAIANEETADTQGADARPVFLPDLIACLPPPSSWQGIRDLILRRPIPPVREAAEARERTDWLRRIQERLLRLFAQRLVEDEDGQWAEWTALRQDHLTMGREYIAALKAAKASRASKTRHPNLELLGGVLQAAAWLHEIGYGLIKRTGDPQKAITGLEWEISAYVMDNKIAAASADAPNAPGNHYVLNFPNTPGFAEQPEAKALVRRLLLSPEFRINVPPDSAVQRFVRRVAVENLAQLPNKSSVWELTCDLSDDSITLYETLAQRFAREKPTEESAHARSYQVARLALRGRRPEALEIALRSPRSPETLFNSDIAGDIEKSGHNREWYEFMRELLRRWPDAPIWESLVRRGAALGRGDEALSLARAGVARKNRNPEQREQALKALSDAAFAYDKTEEGIAALRGAIRLALQNAARPEGPGRFRHGGRFGANSAFPYAEQMVKLSMALNRPDWTDEGLRLASRSLQTGQERFFAAQNYVMLLIGAGKYADAEKTLFDIIRRETGMAGKKDQYPDSQMIRASLIALIGVYDAQHRWADILTILTRTPLWESGDLRDLLTTDAGKTTVGMAAAHALAAKGRTNEAIAITRAALTQQTKDDDFAFYLKLVGAQAAIPYLDELAARDRFEERPLIWKAVALFRLKRYDDAEKTARAALAIDPSDGDAPHGDRMRAYAVLSQIRQAQGDAKEAAFLGSVVRAIRLAEQADDLAEAGLTSRAIGLYTDSLTFFADAYCIQSRLAVKLAGMGRLAQAEVHLRKAYELMPDSFGRMESHCFGCEGAFSLPQGARIAEQVLTRLAVERPNKAQVFYLLGYVQEQQGQYTDALPNFKRAVELDPDYLNAWVHLAQLRDTITLSPEDKQAITTNLIRLSPQSAFDLSQRDAGDASTQTLADKYRMAQEMIAARKTMPAPPLFPLSASAAAIKGKQPPPTDEEIIRQTMDSLIVNDFILQRIVGMMAPFSFAFASSPVQR